MGRPAGEASRNGAVGHQDPSPTATADPEGSGFWQDLSRAVGATSRFRLPIVRGKSVQKSLYQVHVWIKAGRNLRVVDEASGGESTALDAHCICEVTNQPSRNVRTETLEGSGNLLWNHQGQIPDFCEDESLDFNVWDATQFIGHCHLSNQRTFAGFEGDLTLTGGMFDGGQLEVRVQVFPQRPSSGSQTGRTGQAHGVGTSHGRLPPRISAGKKKRRPWSATASCTWPRSERPASEPPTSRRVHKETDKKHGPERLYYDLPLPPSREAIDEESKRFRNGGGAGVGLNHHPLKEFTRPGLDAGGQASPKWKRPRSAEGRLEHYCKLGPPTNPKQGPERLYFESSKYTGTAKLGGPSTQQTGIIRQVVALGSLRLPSERSMPFPKGNADKYRLFVRRGEYEGRPYFEQAGGGSEHLYLYCHPQEKPEPDKWCISDTLGDQPSQAWASANGDSSRLPPGGQWNTNTKRAAGLVRVTTEELYAASLGQVVRPNVGQAHSKAAQLAYATRLSQTKQSAATPTKPMERQAFQEATANSKLKEHLPRLPRPKSAGRGPGPTTRSGLSRTWAGRPTNPAFGPERFYYDTSTYTAAALQGLVEGLPAEAEPYWEDYSLGLWNFSPEPGGRSSRNFPTSGEERSRDFSTFGEAHAEEGGHPGGTAEPSPLESRPSFAVKLSESRNRTLRVVR